MSKKAQYSDYVVLRGSGEVFKLVVPFAWERCDTVLVVSRYGEELPFPKNNLIRIPNEFTAYIKSYNCCHHLDGSMQALLLDEIESEKSFHDLKEESGVWFKAGGLWIPLLWIPLDDIELATPTSCIPPMPSLEELQKCSIHYEGRKTIITYYDAFVGEAICHPDDEFKVESGIAIAYSRAKKAKDEYGVKHREIVVGDTVKVVSAGSNFSIDTPWLYDNIQNFSLVKKYAFGDYLMDSPDRFDNFTVLYIGQDKIAYIQNCKNEICRIIPIKALALA